MTVVVNGTSHDLPEGTTLRQLIERLGLHTSACAAEVNKSLVPRREHESKALQQGDRIELVTLVGGG